MPKGTSNSSLQARKWLSCQESRSLRMLICSQKKSGAPAGIIEILRREVPLFFQPPDFLIVVDQGLEVRRLDTFQEMCSNDDEWDEIGSVKVSAGGDYIFATPFKKGSGKGCGPHVCGYEIDNGFLNLMSFVRFVDELRVFLLPSFGDSLAVSAQHVAAGHVAAGHRTDSGIVLLESPNLRRISQLELGGNKNVNDLRFTTSGEHLLAARDHEVHLLSVGVTLTPLRLLEVPESPYCCKLLLLHDQQGAELVAFSSHQRVLILDVDTLTTRREYDVEQHGSCSCFTLVHNHIVIGTSTAQVHSVDTMSKGVTATISLDKSDYNRNVVDLKYVQSRNVIFALQPFQIYVLNASDLQIITRYTGLDEPDSLEVDPLLTMVVLNMDLEPEPAVIQDVEHVGEEAVAVRDEEMRRLQVEHHWADAVEKLIDDQAEVVPNTAIHEQVFLFKFTRMPKDFVAALDKELDLRLADLRKELDERGLPYRLQGKARVLVWPNQYQTVMDEIREQGIELETSSVIILESLMPVLEDIVSSAPSKRNVRVKNGRKRAIASVASRVPGPCSSNANDQEAPDFDDWARFLIVEKTFLTAVRVRDISDDVTKSTTQAHGGLNHRRKFMSEEVAPMKVSNSKFILRLT